MKKIIRLVSMLLLSMILVITYNGSGSEAMAKEEGKKYFDGLEHDAKYLGSDFRDNYYLDIQECGMMDLPSELINSIANMLFSLVKGLAFVVCDFFYSCMEFNIAELFEEQINGIQSALKSSVFNPLLVLALCGTSWILITHLIKRNFVASISEISKVVLVVFFSFLLVEQSAAVLTACTNITKSISIAAMIGINGNDSGGSLDNYAAEAAGVLWVNLVHEPWKSLEFGSDPQKITENAEEMEKFLSNAYQPSSEARKELVEKYAPKKQDSVQYFSKETIGAKRVGELFTYLIPFFIKCIIYIVMSMIQICFQILGLMFFMLAPLVLLLALVPGFGMSIINAWLKKLLETQISIFIVTLALGLLIKCDSMLFALSAEWGYLIVMVFQIAAAVGLYLGRDKIINAFGKMQKGMQNPAYMMALMRNSGNVKQLADTGARMGSRAVELGKKTAYGTATTAVAAGHMFKKDIYDPIVGVASPNGLSPNSAERKRPNLSESIESSMRQQAAIQAKQKENSKRMLQKKFIDDVGQKAYKAESFVNKVTFNKRPKTRSYQSEDNNYQYKGEDKQSRSGNSQYQKTTSNAGTKDAAEKTMMRTVKEGGNNFKKDIITPDFNMSDSLQRKADDAKMDNPIQRPVTDTSIHADDINSDSSNKDIVSIQNATNKKGDTKGEPTQEGKKERPVEKKARSTKVADTGSRSVTPEINIPSKNQSANKRKRPTTDLGMSDETKQMLAKAKAK